MPREIHIRSADNAYQRADVLKRNREKRHHYGEFLVEGVALLNQLRASIDERRDSWKLRAFLRAKGRKLSDWAEGMLSWSSAEQHYVVRDDLFEELSEKEETSELLAIVRTAPDDFARIPVRENGLVTLFDRPNNPGNLGSSIRSCDALAADGAIVTGHAADIYHPHAVRGTMGALFAVPVVRAPAQRDVEAWLESSRAAGVRYAVVGTSAKGECTVAEHDFSGPTLLLFGNETAGLSRGYKELCDTLVNIPMLGASSSLNVSCAATVVLYEVQRQRGRMGVPRTPLVPA